MSDGDQLDEDVHFREEEAGISVGLKFLNGWSGKELWKKVHMSKGLKMGKEKAMYISGVEGSRQKKQQGPMPQDRNMPDMLGEQCEQ